MTVIAEAGVDTWSLCWYLGEGTPGTRAMEALATEPTARGKMLPEEVVGHRVGWFPGSRLLFAEGHPREGGLGRSEDLLRAADSVSETLCDLGVLLPRYRLLPLVGADGIRRALGDSGFAGVRRLDSTVDLHFDDPVQGLALLTGVAAIRPARIKTRVHFAVGDRRVETVELKGYSGRNMLGRVYDKGVHPDTAAPVARGLWIRPEDQRRFDRSTRPPLEAVADGRYVRDSFVRRFEPLWMAAQGVKVGGILQLARRLGELQEAGEITPAEAVRAAGTIVLDSAGEHRQSRATVMRNRRLVREHGLVLADGILEEVDVDLASILEECMETDAWEAQG